MLSVRVLLLSSVASAAVGLTARGDAWPGWRGAAGRSVSLEVNLPTEWSHERDVAWSAPVRGRGNSSPVVAGRCVFVTTQDEEDQTLWVVALSRETGALLWERKVGQGGLLAYGPPSMFGHRHNPATSSPSADERHVWAFFGTGDLVCFNHDGDLIWSLNLADAYGAYDLKYGMASSPRLWGNRLFVACLHKGPSYVLALDAGSGQELWLTSRNYPALGDAPDAYSSPVVLERDGGPPQLIVSGCDHVDAYDLETGERLWFSEGLLIPDEEYPRVIASPAVGDGTVVASAGRGQQAIAIRADGSGDVTETHRLWTTPRMTDCPMSTVHDGLVYSVRDDGVATTFELQTGEIVWRKRLGGNRYQASPVVGGNNVYYLSLDGKCTVVRAGRDFEVLAQNHVPGEFYATPALSDGVIYLRDRSTVHAIGRRAPGGAQRPASREEVRR